MALDSDLTLAATLATELSVSSGDAKLPRYIASASDAVRRYLGRPQLHYSAAYVEKLKVFSSRVRLVFGLTPIVSVASIVLADGSTCDSSEYSIEDSDLGLVYRRAGWSYSGLYYGGLLYADRAVGTEEKAVTATYAGGWSTPYQASTGGPARTLPYDIEEACIQTAVSLYRRGGVDQAIAAEALGDYSVTYRNLGAGVGQGGIIPDAVLPLLDAYRRLV